MHIVYATSELATKQNSSGGLATYVANISRIFAERGHRVTIILVTTKEQVLEFDNNINLINVYIEKRRWDEIYDVASLLVCSDSAKSNIKNYKAVLMSLYKSKILFETIKKIHNKYPIDIVQTTNLSMLPYQFDDSIPYTVRMSSFLNLCDWCESQYIQENVDWQKMSTYNRLNLDMLRSTRYVFAPSKFLKKIAKEKYDFDIDVIESPFTLSYDNWDYQLYNKLLRNKKYILYFGTLKFLKGIQVIGALSSKLLSKYKDIELVLAGNDTKLQFEDNSECFASEYVKKCAGKYKNRVIYVGRPVREELYPIVEQAKVCVLPSRIENLSNACIEAMALGKVVVATNGVSFEQLIENKKNGFLCERENVDSYMNGLETALSLSDEELQEMGNNAKKTVERLNDNNTYNIHLNYYRRILEEWKE